MEIKNRGLVVILKNATLLAQWNMEIEGSLMTFREAEAK